MMKIKYAECPVCGEQARIPDVPVRRTGFIGCNNDRRHLVPYTPKARKQYADWLKQAKEVTP